MNAPFILVLCLVNVFCLAPLSIYLFYLAILARRNRPTVVSGPWDFAGLTVGLSGFLIFGGGIVLTLIQANFRYWLRGNLEGFRAAWGSEKVAWVGISVFYLLVVVVGIAFTLAGRRRSLVVYNIDPTDFETAVVDVFEQLGRPLERRGNQWVAGVPLFELDPFEGGRTVTLRWVSEDVTLFQEVERLLRQATRNLAADENPASPWLMACAGGAGFWSAGSFALLLVYVFSLK